MRSLLEKLKMTLGARAFSLTIGLVMLTLCVLFVADLANLRSDGVQERRESNKILAEGVALQLSALSHNASVDAVSSILNRFVFANDSVVAARLSSVTDNTQVDFGDSGSLERSALTSFSSIIDIPLLSKGTQWGTVRLVFSSLNSTREDFIYYSALAAGLLIAYLAFLSKVLLQLDPGRAVPARVNSAFNILAEGVIVLDQQWNVLMINKSAYKLLGKPVGFNTGRNIAALSLGCINGEPEPWKAVLKDERSVTNQHMRLANDEQRTLSVNSSLIKSDDGSVSGIMVTLEDITELEVKNRQLSSTLTHLRQSQESITQKNKELEVLASQDPLTGLNNRRSVLIEFQSQLDLVRSSEASEGSLACLMVDIDHFKSINDTYGHAVGDEVICAVANTMTEHCEPKDTVGRIGGEEFVMILPNGTEKPALVAERVREAIQRLPEDVTVSVEKLTASFGIAICEDSIETVEQFLDRADQALYHAKKNGRNRAVVYSEELFEGESPETAQEDSDVEQTEPDAKGSSVRRSHEIKAVDGFDELSGLPKREIFVEQVSKALKQERKGDDCVGLLSLSIRNLDVLSGSLGHEGIEQLTNDFITRIRDGLRHADLVSIIVNEHKLSALSTREYGILLNNLDSGANALTVVTRIQQLLSNPFVLDNKNVYLGAGIGVAIWPDDGADAQTLLDSVSQAQAQSLQSPDKVAFSFASAHQELLSRETLEIESDLHEALIRNQFTIQYQPKLDLAEQRIVGLEALIRWQHPIKGWISPADFIPVAESNGLILEISEFVLDESFTQLAKWHRAGFDDLHMSVNISATQLRDPSIVSNILGHVKNAKLAPQFFDAELTETAIIESPQRAKVALGQLQKAGMTISMDDFGIGYTSLALLADLPLDAVKIDRSFVSAMSRNERSHAIVGSIVNMAHTLDLKVVGEGIETSEQLAMLDALGCDVIQGYLICKPMAAQDMTVFLKEQSRMVKRLRSA